MPPVANGRVLVGRDGLAGELPADPIDAYVVGAFLDALSPVEPDLYDQAVDASPASGSVSDMERKLITTTLEQTNGNRTHAAKLLGISLRTLRNKLREYRLAEVTA